MTEQEREKVRRRFQGKKSRAQGAFFEEIISAGCDYYRREGIADIEKTPEPMKPIKQISGKKFIAVYTEEAQADYKGFLNGGHAVYFEAKSTETGEMKQVRVTKNQTARLNRAYEMGAIVFVLCSFGPGDYYRIPWRVWKSMKQFFGRNYFKAEEVQNFKVRIVPPGVLKFLDDFDDMKEW